MFSSEGIWKCLFFFLLLSQSVLPSFHLSNIRLIHHRHLSCVNYGQETIYSLQKKKKKIIFIFFSFWESGKCTLHIQYCHLCCWLPDGCGLSWLDLAWTFVLLLKSFITEVFKKDKWDYWVFLEILICLNAFQFHCINTHAFIMHLLK